MKNYDYTENEIIQALELVGIHEGDNIFVHSNIGFFGKLKGVNQKDGYCKIFKSAIFNVLGPKGTLVVPTFSYSFCNGQIFDIKKTVSICGIFSEYIRKCKGVLRSDDANFSVVALGEKDEYFTKNVANNPFGKNSFCDRFLKSDGKFCNFNLDSASTFIHYVEKSLKVPYRYDKAFPGIAMINGKKLNKTFYHYVYDLKKLHNSPDFTKFDKKAKEQGLVKTANLGKGQIVCISAKNTLELIKKEILNDSKFLIRGQLGV